MSSSILGKIIGAAGGLASGNVGGLFDLWGDREKEQADKEQRQITWNIRDINRNDIRDAQQQMAENAIREKQGLVSSLANSGMLDSTSGREAIAAQQREHDLRAAALERAAKKMALGEKSADLSRDLDKALERIDVYKGIGQTAALAAGMAMGGTPMSGSMGQALGGKAPFQMAAPAGFKDNYGYVTGQPGLG
jgi:hypothetical protein